MEIYINSDHTVKSALHEASLIKYRRCFSPGVRGGLSHDDIASKLPGAVQFHKYLIDTASKFVAHSVSHFEDVSPVVHINAEGKVYNGAKIQKMKWLFDHDVTQWQALVGEIRHKIIVPRFNEAKKLFAEETSAKTREEIIEGGSYSPEPLSADSPSRPRRSARLGRPL